MSKFDALDDISGKTFERLTVTAFAGRYKNGSAKWLCVCSCGKEVVVIGQKLRNGRQKSCGCLNRELAAQRRTKHGESGTRLFRIWGGMLNRCSNPNSTAWVHYGGRGIRVCSEWLLSFVAFRDWAILNGYTDTLTLERVNVDGDYAPANCRWATRAEQAVNKRNNVRLSDGRLAYQAAEVSPSQLRKRKAKGATVDEAALNPKLRQRFLLSDGRIGSEVAKANGIPAGTFNTRVRAYGWAPDRAATTPVRGSQHHPPLL